MEVKVKMKVSQGIPFGAKAMLYDPDSFQDHEEVIIYQREEFKRVYEIMHDYMKDIFLMDHLLDRDDTRRLINHWAWIMERINIINLEMNSLLGETQSQTYLDTYLSNPVGKRVEEIAESLSIISEESEEELGVGLDWL
jgi:hypothetical protein